MSIEHERTRTSGYSIAPRHQEMLDKHFRYEHLAPALQDVSRPFAMLARDLVHTPHTDPAEMTMALRKLLEAKYCAVRAVL